MSEGSTNRKDVNHILTIVFAWLAMALFNRELPAKAGWLQERQQLCSLVDYGVATGGSTEGHASLTPDIYHSAYCLFSSFGHPLMTFIPSELALGNYGPRNATLSARRPDFHIVQPHMLRCCTLLPRPPSF